MIGLTVSAAAQNIPQGYVIPECTLSPDGRFGVTVPRRKRTKEMFVRATMKPKRRIASKAERFALAWRSAKHEKKSVFIRVIRVIRGDCQS
jgi:hypothetical protein